MKVLFRSSSKDDVTKKISSKEVDSMSKNFQKLLKYDQEKILKTLKILSTLPQDDEDDDDAHAAVLEKSLNKERLEKKDFEKIVEEVDSSNLPFILDANTEQFVWSKLHEVLNDK
ncbi:hypothetical protein [Holospora elegans]|uniref:hypothetical protein n=1 Tax=Holospora elegans TaxID=431043 RepID=UPI0013922C30|nr:hypothetical protein [Holospora elegans]